MYIINSLYQCFSINIFLHPVAQKKTPPLTVLLAPPFGKNALKHAVAKNVCDITTGT